MVAPFWYATHPLWDMRRDTIADVKALVESSHTKHVAFRITHNSPTHELTMQCKRLALEYWREETGIRSQARLIVTVPRIQRMEQMRQRCKDLSDIDRDLSTSWVSLHQIHPNDFAIPGLYTPRWLRGPTRFFVNALRCDGFMVRPIVNMWGTPIIRVYKVRGCVGHISEALRVPWYAITGVYRTAR
jgi:hypothetical protein